MPVGRSVLACVTPADAAAFSAYLELERDRAIALNGRSESDQKAIREQLGRILKSGPFLQSRRRQRFLEYIVNETLAGRGERLKGYNVAQAVFDRSETFDPNVDPIVRMEAARLRDRLREYYETDGQRDPIRIELPKGTYTPQIEFRQAETFEHCGRNGPACDNPDQSPNLAKAPTAVIDEQVSSAPARSERRVRWQITVPALVLILMLGAVGAWFYPRPLDADVPEGAAENPVIERAQRPGDRGPPLHQSERRPETGVFQRRLDRGHPDRAVAGARPARARAQHHLPIQGPGGGRPRSSDMSST